MPDSIKLEQSLEQSADALTAIKLIVGQLDELRDRISRAERKLNEISNAT